MKAMYVAYTWLMSKSGAVADRQISDEQWEAIRTGNKKYVCSEWRPPNPRRFEELELAA